MRSAPSTARHLQTGTTWTKRPRRPDATSTLVAVAVLAAGTYLIALLWAMGHLSYDISGGLLIAPVLIAITVPLAMRAARREDDLRMAKLLTGALVLKFFGAIVRYVVDYRIYKGSSDAQAYHAAGVIVAANFRRGDFNLGAKAISGTRFVEVVTGVVYTVIGPTKLGGFLVFAWMGFWGLYFFYRAFRIAFPDGDYRRYATLLFFLPSLLFWSSGIGKEAWITLTLGLMALGAARILAQRRGGYIWLAAGLWGTNAVRPHIALLILAALLPAYLIRRTRIGLTSPVAKVLGVVFLVGALTIAVGRVEQRFNIKSLNTQGVEQTLNRTQAQTARGGSNYASAGTGRSILKLPQDAVLVLFRPFPSEATNAETLAAGLEGVLLLLICACSWHRIVRAPIAMARSPYLAFAAVYCLLFIYAFAAVLNWGILARQRVQVYPFLFVLLALPLPHQDRSSGRHRLARARS